MICVSLVLIRNVDKCMAWILPLLSDKDARMKVQIFVLRKDTADKERVMDAPRAGLVGPV